MRRLRRVVSWRFASLLKYRDPWIGLAVGTPVETVGVHLFGLLSGGGVFFSSRW